ncbi:23872_t:CDS:2, partial [Gigaspora margarita]
PRYAIHFYSGRGPQIEQSEVLAYRSNDRQRRTEYQSRPSRTKL